MQTAKLKLNEIMDSEGHVLPSAQPLLCEVVERYPFYHTARMLLLKLLYQQHDSQFNDELRKASLFLPSRAKIYQEIEGDSMKPKPIHDEMKGATNKRKSMTPLEHKQKRSEDRTGELLDIFLKETPLVRMDTRSGRTVDAATDYIGWLQTQDDAVQNTDEVQVGNESSSDQNDAPKDRITEFINTQGDKRIQLPEKGDDELQKPTIVESDYGAQQGAFTETLAKIYIKQGKFEQAIEIIRRLSLKYPKKNRYFADQIRFLEKLIINNQAKKL